MRNRFMYYLTGLPGWMRFGFSPGWLGRSPTGLGPCAEYLLTGRWPTWAAPAWAGWAPTAPWAAGFAGAPSSEAELLRRQAEWLRSQLEAIQKRIDELEKEQK